MGNGMFVGELPLKERRRLKDKQEHTQRTSRTGFTETPLLWKAGYCSRASRGASAACEQVNLPGILNCSCRPS